MRIGFVGVGGTGKTTTLQSVNESLELPVLASVARLVWKDFGITEKDMIDNRDYEFALRVQRAIFDKRLKAEAEMDDFISDRTLLDTYCYMLMWCHQSMSDSVAKSLFVVTLENMKKYDEVYYFPLESFRMTSDLASLNVRAPGAAQGLMLDSLIKGMLLKMFPKFYTVQGTTLFDRVEFIKAVMNTVRASR